MPRALLLALVLVALPCSSCGGSDSSNSNATCNPPFSTTLTGGWVFQEMLMGETCSTNGLFQGSFTITQVGSTLDFSGDVSGRATLCGSRATNTGDFTAISNGGIQRATQVIIQFTDPNNASGSTQWTWQSSTGSESCSGTSTFDMTR